MKDEIVFRRRQRLKYHFVNTSKVLLYGYRDLSDAAKITYQVIDGFDWEDKETGDSKGYVFPAVETIADIRGISVRTIQRHIKELEDAKLLTRVRRRYKASVLYIEDVDEAEVERYMEMFVDKKSSGGNSGSQGGGGARPSQRKGKPIAASKSRNDKSVVSRQAAETTKMSILDEPILNPGKEKEVLKKKNNVNVVQKTERQGLQSMGDLMSSRQSILSPSQQGRGVPPKQRAKRDYLAQTLADEFDDQSGLGCYRVIADKLPETVVYRLMAEVKDAHQQGQVRSRPAALFVAATKRWAIEHDIELGFEEKSDIRIVKLPLAVSP